MLEAIFLLGVVVHLLANVGLLFRIWWTRDCSGLSAKSQCLNAAALTFKYADCVFLVHYVSLEITILKIVFIALSYAIVLSILYFFKSTYEKRYDTTRIPTIILPIIIWALWIEQDYYWDTLLALGVMLEIVAMVPQFHFISESMQIHFYVVAYIMTMATSVSLNIFHNVVKLNGSEPNYEYEYVVVVANVAQLIVYCDFSLRILPWLLYRRDKERMLASNAAAAAAAAAAAVATNMPRERRAVVAVADPQPV